MMELLPPFFGPISHAEKNCVRFAMHRVKLKGQVIDEGAHLSSGQNMPFNLDEAWPSLTFQVKYYFGMWVTNFNGQRLLPCEEGLSLTLP